MDEDFSIRDVLYFISGSVLYYFLCSPIAHYVSRFFDSFNTESTLFDDLYYRYYVHTKYLPIQQWVYYAIMLVTGFMFINIVNLKNSRKNPFLGARGYADFKYNLFLAFFLFLTSGVVIFRHSHDLSSYCEK